MLSFDFITDDQFRASLQSDYSEMLGSLECKAWKSVHILAGSIIEALLVEYLVMSKMNPGGKDPLKIVLDEAIAACVNAGALSPKTAKLCDVVKDYRNLIHPGRVIRLQEQFGENTARISVSLVEIITNEVATKRKENYGLTAKQIVHKVSIDERANSLLPHLLQETHEYERRRLVNEIVKQAYMAEAEDIFEANQRTLATLQNCYRLALTSLPEADQVKSARRFANMVRQESAENITTYADVFFSCEEIRFLNASEAILVKNYLFSRWEEYKPGAYFPSDFLETLKGIGPHLNSREEVVKFTNQCVRFVISTEPPIQEKFKHLFDSEYSLLPSEELKARASSHIDTWHKYAQERNYSKDKIERIFELSICCLEIPF